MNRGRDKMDVKTQLPVLFSMNALQVVDGKLEFLESNWLKQLHSNQ